MSDIRRVVTGLDAEDRAVVQFDSQLALEPGPFGINSVIHRLTEVDLMLDETSVHLEPGDVIVQQATNHGWVNRGAQPCRILFVPMDAKEP